MTDEIVLYEARYPAAIITLNNPDHRNALSAAMIDALMAAIARAEEDRRVRALIFTGAGSAFSAGMDLGELRTMLDQLRVDEAGSVWEGALRGEALIERVYRLGKPSIAAVNGVAVGNGAGFLSACDLAVAADSARIGYTEMKHGIQAGMVILDPPPDAIGGRARGEIFAVDGRTGDRRAGQGAGIDQHSRAVRPADGDCACMGRCDRDERSESGGRHQVVDVQIFRPGDRDEHDRVYCRAAHHRRNPLGPRVLFRQEAGPMVAQAFVIFRLPSARSVAFLQQSMREGPSWT
jgi:hypothetical protein